MPNLADSCNDMNLRNFKFPPDGEMAIVAGGLLALCLMAVIQLTATDELTTAQNISLIFFSIAIPTLTTCLFILEVKSPRILLDVQKEHPLRPFKIFIVIYLGGLASSIIWFLSLIFT